MHSQMRATLATFFARGTTCDKTPPVLCYVATEDFSGETGAKLCTQIYPTSTRKIFSRIYYVSDSLSGGIVMQ